MSDSNLVKVTCKVCGYTFIRCTKYLDLKAEDTWVLDYCSENCYKQTTEYYNNRASFLLHYLNNKWWEPES